MKKVHTHAAGLLWAAGLSLAAASAVAQTADTISLRFDDGAFGETITGTMQSYDGTMFVVDSVLGEVAIPAEFVSCIGAACPEGTALEVTSPVITLTSHDGDAAIEGQLIEISDGKYIMATDVGELSIQTHMVSCAGAGCPDPSELPDFDPQVVLTNGAMTIEGALVGMEEGIYLIQSNDFGDIRVSMADFECAGMACP